MHRPFSSWKAWARPIHRRHLAFATISSATLYLGLTKLHSDYSSESDGFNAGAKPPLSSLVRAYTVYTMCSIPSLVDHSPHILRILSSVPVLKQITEAFVRVTFFDQFVGGDNARATIPLLRTLRAQNKGAILGYSAEVDLPSTSNASHSANDTQSYKRFIDEIIRSIDAAADAEDSIAPAGGSNRRSCVALKLTALVSAESLLNYSKHIVHARQSRNTLSVPFPGCPTSSIRTTSEEASSLKSASTFCFRFDIFPSMFWLREAYVIISRIPEYDSCSIASCLSIAY